MFERISILGLGLIGGSLSLAWKRQHPDLVIVGHDVPDVLERAVRRGVIDEAAGSVAEAVTGVDLVVLALPLGTMLHVMNQMAPHLEPGTLVTDVGSVKTPVLAHARVTLPENVRFIGGHPMAGSEKSGLEYADALLFENATYVLCPPADLSGEDVMREHEDFVGLIESTGARVLVLDAGRHDRIAATVSHLPQLLAVALMNYAARRNDDDDAFLRLAAGGFRDMTRIASSSFSMWQDILLANQGPLLDALGGFAAALQRLRNRLIEEDFDALGSAFYEARRVRETIPRDSRGFLHPLADIYVYAEDRPGELFTITRTLYEAELNVKDIELLKIREGTGGAFRMSFSDDEAADAAVDVLRRAGYHAYRL